MTTAQTSPSPPSPAKKDPVNSIVTTRTTSTTARRARPAGRPGKVSFVGTGPGDPGLLTVRAVDLIRAAEVVIIESPAHRTLVDALRSGDSSGHTLGGELTVVEGGINDAGAALTHAVRGRLVVKHARGGAHVVRLLAGDVLTHGTGPEEAQACRKAGLDVEVIPGVASALAVPAYAGVPLTTRGSERFGVVRVDDNRRTDWTAYADDSTLVLLVAASADLMHTATAAAAGLVSAGRAAATAVSVTRGGTTTAQTTTVSTLADLGSDLGVALADGPDPAESEPLTGDVVIVVGDNVELREQLSWYETKPLFGWRVLVPRTKEQAGPLAEQLHGHGAVAEEVPTISVEPPRNPQQMDKAVRGLVEGRYEWVAFTSVNAVRAVREKFDEYGLDARAFSGLKVAAVGEATADAIRTWGIRPDLVPSGEQSGRGLLEDWPPFDAVLDPINRVFLPRADIATETLMAGLQELGWEAEDVTAYRTVRAAPPPAPVREAIKAGRFDAVVFTSSSTVRNLVGIAGKPHPSTVIACIGPVTAKTAEEHGLRVDVLAESPTVEVLAEGLADFGARRRMTAIEAGEPVTRPSERRTPVRRKAT